MTHNRRCAFMLTNALYWIVLVAMITTLGTYVITRSLRVQYRTAAWSNDDAVAQSVLGRMRQDVGAARDASISQESVPVLVLQRPDGEVRYRGDGNMVERIECAKGGTPVRHVWHFGRCSVRLSLESIPDRGKVVWARVQMLDQVEQDAPPAVHHYAVAWCVGLRPFVEDMP